MVDTNTLKIGWTRSDADRERARYRSVLGFVLAAETVLALAMVFFPAWSASWSAYAESAATPWVRTAGVFWLAINVFHAPAWFEPVYQRWPNAVGFAWRLVLAGAGAFLGGYLWWVAAAELALAVGLPVLYWRLVRAELLCRP